MTAATREEDRRDVVASARAAAQAGGATEPVAVAAAQR